MPAIPAIIPAIMAGAQIGGAAIKSRGAKKAAKTQVRGATEVAERARETSGSVAGDVRRAGTAASERSLAAGEAAAGGVEGATTEANLFLKDIHGQSRDMTEPYRETGGEAITYLGDLLAPEGEFNQRFGMEDFQADPGYAFRLEEGAKALERSAAGRGILNSGSTLKALTKYSQGAASQEYQNAYERFMEQRKTRYGMLSGVAGFGERATGRQLSSDELYAGRTSENITRGSEVAGGFRVGGADTAGRFDLGSAESAGGFTMEGERIAGDAMLGAANARAAGQVGSANAWSSGIQGAGQTVGQALMMRDMVKKRPRAQYV